LLHGFLGGTEFGLDAGALAQIPAPAGENETCACCNEEKDLRHG
jgi:hypothetical protein